MENLSEKTPSSRVVNHFRINPEECSSGFFWSVTPNSSNRTFYFNKLSLAEEFCNSYLNSHFDAFWYRLWVNNPIYHYNNVVKLVDLISYML